MIPRTALAERLSLNQYTTHAWSLEQAIAGCVAAGIPAIGLWRDRVAAAGLQQSARLMRESGLALSSLCRGGMFPAPSAPERQQRLEDNRRAIDEAATLGTDTLVLVCGGMNGCTLEDARQMVADGIAALLPYAAARGVRLGIEPLHPMYAADRSVIVTLGQANALVEKLASPQVGVIIDVYHVWWDPQIYQEIARAAGHILGFHVNDWLAPPPDVLLGRGMMGDGVIEVRRLRQAVEAAGYQGYIEVEIFNQALWDSPGEQVLSQLRQRFLEHV